jgi:catecholate siderophore receptor
MTSPSGSDPSLLSLGAAIHTVGAVGLGFTVLGLGPSAVAQTDTPAESSAADHSKAPNVSEVVVTGLRPLLGDKIPLSVRDTPQSVNIVSEQLLREQSVTRLEDALKNVPGVTLNAGEGAARGDTINIRGFSAFRSS